MQFFGKRLKLNCKKINFPTKSEKEKEKRPGFQEYKSNNRWDKHTLSQMT